MIGLLVVLAAVFWVLSSALIVRALLMNWINGSRWP